MSKGSGSDAGAGCIAFLLTIYFIVMAILIVVGTLVAAYLSVMAGKALNYVLRVGIGWTLNRDSNKNYIAFCTILVLFLVPIGGWLYSVLYSLGYIGYGNPLILAITSLALIGYYSAHFDKFPEKLAWLQVPGMVILLEQEEIWRSSIRTKTVVFWHWTIAKHAVAIDAWFRTSISKALAWRPI